MTIIERVQKRLKPKVKQFGFTKKVFKSVAAEVADKLDIDEDASDEDTDSKVDEAIEAVMPYLSLIQSQGNALHEEWKKSQKKDEDEEEEDDDDSEEEESKSNTTRKNHSNKSTKTKENDGEPAWFKKFREEQEAKFAKLAGEKLADTRRSKLEKLLKDTGTFGKRTLKNFSRMNFKDDEEFEDFYSDVEEDLKALNQELADKGLSTMGNPPGGKGEKQEKKEEAFSDDEIDAMAD